MTEVEFDLASSDVYDSIKAFIQYCPNGSMESATKSALSFIRDKFVPTKDEYHKLLSIARNYFKDLARKQDQK